MSGDIEALTVRTIGLKNCDVQRALADVALPAEVRVTYHNCSGRVVPCTNKWT